MSGASAAIRAALRGYEPSTEQWEAIRTPLEPVVIRAGAGSGKTAVMTARIVHLVETNQARPAGVLGLTFTNKAAGELAERLHEAMSAVEPRPVEHPTVMTYHAFAQQLVREHAPRIGVDPDSGLLSSAQKWQILMGLVDDLPDLHDIELRHPLSFIPQTLQLADQCATHLATPEALEAECVRLLDAGLNDDWAVTATKKRREFAGVIRSYMDRKRELHRIDFGDQIRLAVEICGTFPDVVAELRERYPVVLLDEYQDTDPAQKIMLRYLCPTGSAVTAVGDARQAIYGWRGASMFNLINFHQEFRRREGVDAHQASLSENYRSGRRIVALANRIIQQVPAEHRPGDELVAVPHTGEGWIGSAVFSDQRAEAAYLGAEIDRLHDQGTPWKEMAILVRSRRYLDEVITALEEADIPFEMPDIGGLLKVPAVTDVVAWLHVVSELGPSINRWAARILMGPRYRVHYRDLAPIARWAVERNRELAEDAAEALGVDEADPGEVRFSLLEALAQADEIDGVSDEARRRIAGFLALVAELREHRLRGLQQLVQTVVDRTGIAETLAASPARTAAAMRENLNGFTGVCSEFSPLEGDANLNTFLEYLDVAEESEDAIPLATTSTSDSVKVMTIHKAKGLEFDVVFVPHVASSPEDGYDGLRKRSIFPDVRGANPLTSTQNLPPGVRQDADDLPTFTGNMSAYRRELRQRAEHDERRLFYVACTRARQRLYITAAHWYASEDEVKGGSTFLEEVRDFDETDTLLGHTDAAPPANPIVEQMRDRLVWPPEPDQPEARPWIDRVLAIVSGDLDAASLVDHHDAADLYDQHLAQLAALRSAPTTTDEPERRSISATDAARVVSGTASVDTLFHPLPQRPTPAQRLGTEVHAWIEELHRGLTGLAEEGALDDASLPPTPEEVSALKEAFTGMGYVNREPVRLSSGEPGTEVPFTVKIPGWVIRGRIDAIYEPEGDGSIEIVDFKTGVRPDEVDWSQLELYAEALSELGVVSDEVTLTYAFLRDGRPASRSYRPVGLDRFTEPLVSALAAHDDAARGP